MEKLKILSISPFEIYPPNYGGAIGIYYRLKYLKERGHNIFCILPEPEYMEYKAFLKKDFDDVVFIRKKRRLVSLLKYAASSSSYYSSKFTPDKQEFDILTDFIRAKRPDVVIYEGSHCIGIHNKLKHSIKEIGAKSVHYSHNIEYNFSYYNYKSFQWNNIWKIISYIDYIRFKRSELKYIKEFKLVFSISDKEKNLLKNFNTDASIEWTPPVMPDVFLNCPADNFSFEFSKLQNDYAYRIIFTGHLKSPHNVTAVKWFYDKVLPILRKEANVCFVMAGKDPAKKVLGMAKKNEHVFVYPNVISIEPFMQLADIVVVPLFSDAGIKIKLIEALKYGKKVVARPEALYGSGLEDVVPSAETPEDFAAMCLKVLQGKVNYENVWKIFNALYNNNKIIEKIESELRRLTGVGLE